MSKGPHYNIIPTLLIQTLELLHSQAWSRVAW